MRNLLMCGSLFLLLFGLLTAPFTIRNVKVFGSLLPGLLPIWGAVNFYEYLENPSSRTPSNLDAQLSVVPAIRNVYFDKTPSIDLRNPAQQKAFVMRGLKELAILLVIFKRSYITGLTLIVLACLSFFILHGRARDMLLLFLIYLAFSLIAIPFSAHTEQRYFIFIIPFTCMFAAFMLERLEKLLLADYLDAKMYRIAYRMFIACLLALIFLVPAAKLYSSALARCAGPYPLNALGEWIRDNTPSSSVVMSTAPYRIGYYCGRPTVMLPDTSPSVIGRICDHYAVGTLAVPQAEAARLEAFVDSSSGCRPFKPTASIDASVMFSYFSQPCVSFPLIE